MTAQSKLNRELFRLASYEDQLILAGTLALTEAQDATGDPVIGISADFLWDWCQDCMYTEANHPNVDHVWPPLRAWHRALRRCQNRGLLRGSPDPGSFSGALLRRPTSAAGRHLSEQRVFAYWPNGRS
jgi:hypothetical protein